MPSKKRGSDNSSNRSSRPSSSKSTAARQQEEQYSEENSRDTNAGDSNNIGTGADAPSEYKVNTRVMCQHTDTFFYDAKIINVQRNNDGIFYTIHYQGWNSRYDEVISHDDAINKFKPYSTENVKIANQERKDAQSRKRPRGSIKNKKEKNPAVPTKKHRSATPAKTNTSARNTPVDLGEYKPPTKAGQNALGSVLSETPAAIPLRLHKGRIEVKIPSTLLDVLVKDAEIFEKQSKLVKLPANFTIEKIVKDYESSERNPYSHIPNGETLLFGNIDALLKTFSQRLSSELIFGFENSQFLDILNKKRNELGYSDITMAAYRSTLSDDGENPEIKHESSESKDEPVTMRETRSKRQSKVESDKRASTKKELNPGPLNDEDLPFSNVYGFIHFVRFLHQLISSQNMPVGMFNFYAPLIADLLDFLSSKKNDYYKQEADYEVPSKSYKANH